MTELLQENWLLVLAALLIGLLVAWWIFVASRRTTIERAAKDHEEASTARRNQALIDAPPVAASTRDARLESGPGEPATPATPSATAEATHDFNQDRIASTATAPGATSAAANTAQTAASPLGTDAETGDGVPMREAMRTMADDPAADGEPDKTPNRPASTNDELLQLKGVGPKLVALLHGEGITTLGQIAAMDDAAIDTLDARLGRFQGRIRRDNWVEQAQLLSGGDRTAYEERFGRTG